MLRWPPEVSEDSKETVGGQLVFSNSTKQSQHTECSAWTDTRTAKLGTRQTDSRTDKGEL